jgi:hydroxymethylglutaryl-CoA lyase (EC 4.1.3.4)
MILPEKVTIIEVGPRDGLQNEKSLIPTDVKKTFISKLKAAGFRAMELSSFVSPKWVPQMADAEEIVVAFASTRGKNYVLVPNKRGIERLRKTGIRDAAIFIGVSDTFNKKILIRQPGKVLRNWLPSSTI